MPLSAPNAVMSEHRQTRTTVAGHPPAQAPDLQAITTLVHGFYRDVRQDPLLGPVFEKALHGHWDEHLQRLVDFWSTVALGTRSFKGDVLGKHMALGSITPAHFAAWVRMWQRHTELCLHPMQPANFKWRRTVLRAICFAATSAVTLHLRQRLMRALSTATGMIKPKPSDAQRNPHC